MNPSHPSKGDPVSKLICFEDLSNNLMALQIAPVASNRTKGKHWSNLLRSFSSRSASALGESRNPIGKANCKFASTTPSDGAASELQETTSGEFSDGKVCVHGQEDEAKGEKTEQGSRERQSKRSRRLQMKQLRHRLLHPVRSMIGSYAGCMTAASGNAKLIQGFHSSSDAGPAPNAEADPLEFSQESIRLLLENNKFFGTAISD